MSESDGTQAAREAKHRAARDKRIELSLDRLARDLRLPRYELARAVGFAVVLSWRPGREHDLECLRELARVPSPF